MDYRITVAEIIEAVNASLVHQGDFDYVSGAVASGLMSDVLASEEEEILLISNLTTTQLVRTADMVGAHAILITNDRTVTEDILDLAKDLSITLLKTKYTMFESCYRIGKIFYES
jgi:predicted transcriptional regulator